MYKLILIILFVAIITTFLGGHEDFSENDHSFFSFLNFNSNPDIKYLRSSLFGLFQSNYSHTPTYAPVYSSTLYTPAQIPESVPTPTRSPAYAPVYLPPNDNQNNYKNDNKFSALASASAQAPSTAYASAPAQDPSTAYAITQAARYGSYSKPEYGKQTNFAGVKVLM
jgi:hypothetical protein